MADEEFDNDVSIEPGQLDVEAVRQAETFFKYSERLIAARAEEDRLEHAAEVLEARLQMEARKDPETFDLTSVTEASIKAAVKINKKYILAVEAYFQAKAVANRLKSMVDAMEQKKRMIEVLITLHGQQYFAGPSVPHDLVGAWKDHQSRGSAAVNERQRGTARRVRQGG